MKHKEFQEYKNKPGSELEKDLVTFRAKLANLKFDLAAGKVKNIREIRRLKKDIARVITIIKNKK